MLHVRVEYDRRRPAWLPSASLDMEYDNYSIDKTYIVVTYPVASVGV